MKIYGTVFFYCKIITVIILVFIEIKKIAKFDIFDITFEKGSFFIAPIMLSFISTGEKISITNILLCEYKLYIL